ncbi:MAG: tryptophan synthase subunit alpha [Armatimonadetes bacterium]|nr:tryptophan synthase subunit alpha [Armatimonadota bacterium]
MGRLQSIFEACAARGERVLVPYITAGDPDLAATAALLPALAAGGADIIEIGVPFSDPLMDGPTIQRASHRALAAGTTPHGVMATVAQARAGLGCGLIYMVPFNLVWRYGLERFAVDCAQSGVDGVLITDLPPEEADDWQAAADAHGVETIYLLAPTSSPERIRLAAARATGFIYLISRRGVTGVQSSVPTELADLVAGIRAQTAVPIAVGFGIATAQQVAQVCAVADGAVVGSALVDRLAAAADSDARVAAAETMIRELKAGTIIS